MIGVCLLSHLFDIVRPLTVAVWEEIVLVRSLKQFIVICFIDCFSEIFKIVPNGMFYRLF